MKSKWSGGAALVERRAPRVQIAKDLNREGPMNNRPPQARVKPSLATISLLAATPDDDRFADAYYGWQFARAMRDMESA